MSKIKNIAFLFLLIVVVIVSGCVGQSEATKQSIPNCESNWQCSDWSDCSRTEKTGGNEFWNVQIRTCMDLNNCSSVVGKPLESQACTLPAIATKESVQTPETTKKPTYTYMNLSLLADKYRNISIDCTKENITKLSLNERISKTIISSKEDGIFKPLALTYEWFPQLNEGRFGFINLDLINDGCTKIIPNVQTFIFDDNKNLIFESRIIDSKYLSSISLKDNMELYPKDEYFTFGNVNFPIDGGNYYEIPKITVQKNVDYILFILFTDEKASIVAGVYKFEIPKYKEV